jgi:putative transposase
MARRKQPIIADALLDQLLGGADPKTAFAKDGLLDELKKALAERALNAEMDQHLAGGDGNSRNGYGSKTILTDTGKIDLDIPRDRRSTFDPQLIAKYQRRFPGFDEKIVSMYARGMSVREIQGHLRDLYGLDASPDLVSAVTDAVLEEIAEWQNRPLVHRSKRRLQPEFGKIDAKQRARARTRERSECVSALVRKKIKTVPQMPHK